MHQMGSLASCPRVSTRPTGWLELRCCCPSECSKPFAAVVAAAAEKTVLCLFAALVAEAG
jgi:hypothetical protein